MVLTRKKAQLKKDKNDEANIEVMPEEGVANVQVLTTGTAGTEPIPEKETQDGKMAEAEVNEEQDLGEHDHDEQDHDGNNKEEKEKEDPVEKEKSKKAPGKPKEHRDETREQSDLRSLYIGKLPDGVTKQDLYDLSENILEVHIPQQKNGLRFAFIRFDNEAEAEANLKILQTKEIKGQPLTVDFVGVKSSFKGSADKEERNNRKLYIGSLPEDVTEEELKSLSEDIVEIFISHNMRYNQKRVFAFLTFESEEKAESNYEILKNGKIRDQPIVVDYNGSKSSRPDPKAPKQVLVTELPLDVTIEQLAPHFKKAYQITLNRHAAYRTAAIDFDTTEDAKEANDAAKDVTILDQKIKTVLRKEPDWKSKKFPGQGGQFRGRGGNNNWLRKEREPDWTMQNFGGNGDQFGGWGGNNNLWHQEREPDWNNQYFGGYGGQFRGRGGNNNWGKRGHSGDYWDGQRFGKRMRY